MYRINWFAYAVQVVCVVAVGTGILSYFLPDTPWYHWVGLSFLAAVFIRSAMNIGTEDLKR